jgi:hypothetical protein
MSVVAAAVVGSAVVGGYSSYKSGKAQEKAAKAGADAETQLGYANIDLQKRASTRAA